MLQRVAADMPVPDPKGSLEDFKRYAVCHLIQFFAAGPRPFAETDADEIARYARVMVAVTRAKLSVVGTDTEEAKQARTIKAMVDSGMTVWKPPMTDAPDEDPAIASLLEDAAQLANGFGRVGEASQRFRQAEPKPSCWNEKGSNETQSESPLATPKERRIKSAVR